MRVLLLNYEYPPAGGGAGFATQNIARELAKMGLDVDVLTARIVDENDAIEDGVSVYRVSSWRKGMHDCGIRGAWSYVAGALFRRRKLLQQRNYDIEHFFFSLPTAVLTLVPGWMKKSPYVVSLRGSDVPGYDPFNGKVEFLHKLLLPATRRIWCRAGRVVALSDGLRQIAKRAVANVHIDIIPNGIDPLVFQPKSPSAGGNDGPIAVICVARLLERKGIHHLLRAIASPEPLDVHLTIVGTGSYEFELKKLVSTLGLNDRVRFLGFVEHNELPKLYRESDIFALPSQTESFGLVFAEAMASGLPVVATRVGGIPELITDGKEGFLVEPGDCEAIRRNLEILKNDDVVRAQMSIAARKRIEEKFIWRRVAEQYLQVYREVLARAGEA